MAKGGGGSARGYAKGQVYLRPGSEASRALETLVAETTRLGHAITLVEWRAAHLARAGETLAYLDSTSSGLRRRGLVAAAAGRTKSLQYYAVSAPRPARAEPDPYDTLTTVVIEECARTGVAVTLPTIRTALGRRGLARTSDQVSTMLEALTTASDERAFASQVAARLEVFSASGEHWVRAHRFWRPVHSNYPAAVDRLPTRGAALRSAVCATVAQLGRPVSPAEVKSWALAHPAHPAADAVTRASATRFGSALRTMVYKDSGTKTGMLVDYSDARASDGGIPLRIGPATVSPIELATARYLDLCYWLRPTEELTSCDHLRAEAHRRGIPALQDLADQRAHALASVIRRELLAVSETNTIPWDAIAERTHRAASLLAAWWEAGTTAKRIKTPRWVADVHRAAMAVDRVRDLCDSPLPGTKVFVAGANGLRPLQTAEAWLHEVLRPQDRDFTIVQPFVKPVRRFSNVEWNRDGQFGGDRQPFSFLDVGDLLAVVSDQTSYGDIAVLLRTAGSLLGATVRDPQPLRELLAALPSHCTLFRHGAVVALGALGELVDPGTVVDGPNDRAGVDAYALALAIAPIVPSERYGLLRALAPSLSLDLRSHVQTMARRAERGDTVSVIM